MWRKLQHDFGSDGCRFESCPTHHFHKDLVVIHQVGKLCQVQEKYTILVLGCSYLHCFTGSFDKFRRELRDDCIAIAPQEPHSAGNPISQRE